MFLNINQRINQFLKSQIILINSRCYVSTARSTELPANKYTLRTHTCGQLSKKDIGKRVNLYGWVQYTRFNNKIIALRDSYGVTQCILDNNQLNNSIRKTSLYNESVIQVTGVVRQRPGGQENKSLTTGDIEILTDHIHILNLAKKDLSILARDDCNTTTPTSINRLKYRYLDIRSTHMQHALRFRSEVCKILRDCLYDLNFVECETPTLYCRTPGGANEFIVPTQLPDQFYSLVQSPQQLKQLLMIGGLDRYFQICRCYRDETGRPDRQPEFTQVDIEISFTNQDMIMKLIEELMFKLFTKISDQLESGESLLSSFHPETYKLQRMSFHEAFDKYGTDKPDTRYGWRIESNEEQGLFMKVPHTLSENILQDISQRAKACVRADLPCPDIDHKISDSFTIFVTKDKSVSARKLLGSARTMIADELVKQGEMVFDRSFGLLWVTDFPLFTLDDEGKLEPNHHPFTAPTDDSIHLIKQKPLRVVGQHYDLVLNGQEIAGGSIRIHDAELQRQIFTEILRVDDSTFGYFLDALRSGCPPHGGIAIGLDRLIAILLNRSSIKDVIAFPKTSSGRDLMTDSPHELSTEVKRLYHIK